MTLDQRRTVYRYYFLPEEEKYESEPLVICPKCKEDLTQKDSIEVDLASGELPRKFMTSLDCGALQDTADLKILRGGKLCVACSHCKCSLADLDDVYEEELVI